MLCSLTLRNCLVLTLSTLHHPCLPPSEDVPRLPHSPPTLSTGLWPGVVLKDWMVDDGQVCSPMSAPRSQDLSRLAAGAKKTAAVHRCKFHITVMHAFVDTLDIFTWTRKCVIWWKALRAPDWPPLLSCYKPLARFKHHPWECMQKCAILYFICQQEQY